MASDDLKRSGGDQAAGSAPGRPDGSSKGIFDHLAEYLLQQPLADPAASAPPPAPEAPAVPAQQQTAGQAPPPSRPGDPELRSQELVFAETAERLVVEKEVVVREEVVLSKLAKEHVQDINESVRHTEVEVERITPAEAERIEKAAPPAAADLRLPVSQAEAEQIAKAAPPAAVDLREPVKRPSAALPPRATSVKQPATRSLAWWVWYALILGAGLLIAFALGQLIGSPGD